MKTIPHSYIKYKQDCLTSDGDYIMSYDDYLIANPKDVSLYKEAIRYDYSPPSFQEWLINSKSK